MKSFSAVVELCPETGLYVGYVPGWPGAHTQAESLDELQRNLREVIEMLLEDGEPALEVTKSGQADRTSPYQNDGISGATITGDGVEYAVHYWLGDDAYGPYLKEARNKPDSGDGGAQ